MPRVPGPRALHGSTVSWHGAPAGRRQAAGCQVRLVTSPGGGVPGQGLTESAAASDRRAAAVPGPCVCRDRSDSESPGFNSVPGHSLQSLAPRPQLSDHCAPRPGGPEAQNLSLSVTLLGYH
eukprot:63350-Hanusia_phi.AAC.1